MLVHGLGIISRFGIVLLVGILSVLSRRSVGLVVLLWGLVVGVKRGRGMGVGPVGGGMLGGFVGESAFERVGGFVAGCGGVERFVRSLRRD